MSMPQRMVSDEFSRISGSGPLAINNLSYQCTTRTSSANRLITDSAAAATAIACGEKANNGALGLTPDGRRCTSVAELARDKGMKVGIVTTVGIVHATPAGFYAHRSSRGQYYGIALDLVDSRFDYFAGSDIYKAENDTKSRYYRGNIFDLAQQAGYTLVRDKAAFEALKPGCGKVWGIFSKGALPFSIDKNTTYPTLAELTAKGIELLAGEKGFFMMVEGGKIDYAAHGNDAATLVHETLALDAAVKVALDFAKRHPQETLIVVTGDHETGGLSMGFAGTGYKFLVKLLARQKCSAEAFSNRISARIRENPELAFEDVKQDVTEAFGLYFDAASAKNDPEGESLLLTAAEIEELEKAFAHDVSFAKAKKEETRAHDVARRRRFAATARRLLSNHAGIGWSSGAHTALPTLTTAYGCGAETFTGFIENSEISHKIKALLK